MSMRDYLDRITSHDATNSSNTTHAYYGPMITPKIAGIVGLCLTSFLGIIVSWRLFYHHLSLSQCRNCFQLRTDELTTKRLQHGFLWTVMLVELVAYANMVQRNDETRFNYTALNIVGMGILENNTFIIGTIHWFNIISRGRAEDRNLAYAIYPVLTILSVGLTVVSLYEAVDVWTGGYDTVEKFYESSKIYKLSLLIEAAGWGVHSGVVAICAVIAYKRISSLPTLSQVRIEAQRRIVSKMITPMVFCAFSYCLRSGIAAANLSIRILHPDATLFERGIVWWTGYCWVPMFIPSLMLLYSFRKRDKELNLQTCFSDPLLRSVGDEGFSDPFQSFHQMNRDFEYDDTAG